MDPSQRIISHMNKDHQLALIDYLVGYKKVKLSTLDESSVHISAINEKSMDVSYNTDSDYNNVAKFKWTDIPEDENVKVKSMKEIKDKLVSMAKYAAAKQGYSHVKVTKYPEITKDSVFMMSIAVIFAIGCYDMNFLKKLFKNDPITSNLAPYFPDALWKVIGFAADRIKKIAIATYVIHLFEVSYFTIPNIIKYRVPFPQSLAWCSLHLIEGFFTISKFKKHTK